MNDAVVAVLTHLTQSLGGSLGWAIITLSMGIRVALLPLTIRLARRAQRHQKIMRALLPEIERLRSKFEKNPQRFFEEMQKLYKRHNCSPFDIRILAGSLVQFPIFGMLYSAIRSSLGAKTAFLWIRSLASPDFHLTILILALTGVSACLTPVASEQTRGTLIAIQLVVTFLLVGKLAAGLSLYWLSSGAITVFQMLWLRYRSDTHSSVA